MTIALISETATTAASPAFHGCAVTHCVAPPISAVRSADAEPAADDGGCLSFNDGIPNDRAPESREWTSAAGKTQFRRGKRSGGLVPETAHGCQWKTPTWRVWHCWQAVDCRYACVGLSQGV